MTLFGKEAATLADGNEPAGQHSKVFDAGGLEPGIYSCVLRTKGFIQARKLILMKE